MRGLYLYLWAAMLTSATNGKLTPFRNKIPCFALLFFLKSKAVSLIVSIRL